MKRWLWFLPPLGLGLAGVMLLLRVSFVDTELFFPEDIDVLIILFGLGAAVFTAIALILWEQMEQIQQRSVEEAHHDAEAEHARFLRRLDHELKNPLTAMRAGLGSLALSMEDAGQRAIVRTLEAESERLSDLVTHLRKLAELESLPPEAHRINLPAFFAEIADLEGRPLMQERRFIMELPTNLEDMPPLIGDQDLLLLAMHNLLDNAFKYTRPGDMIALQVWVEAGDLAIRVSDTGTGISEADLPYVWEELYRGQNAGDTPGSGIGLALVRTVIEHHYGSSDIQSRLGEGTSVTLRIPLF